MCHVLVRKLFGLNCCCWSNRPRSRVTEDIIYMPFSRRFYPKRLTVMCACVHTYILRMGGPGNRTQAKKISVQ
jgi:hypothetical protein